MSIDAEALAWCCENRGCYLLTSTLARTRKESILRMCDDMKAWRWWRRQGIRCIRVRIVPCTGGGRVMAKSIWLVMADTDYEGSDPVVAFLEEGPAEAFAERCRQYAKKRPRWPEIEDTTENDALWEKHDAKYRRWGARHPAYKDCSRDDFSVCKIKVKS